MKMRNVYKLIEEMKKEVPKKEKGFIKALDNVIDSAHYRAPEAYAVNFEQLSMALGHNLGAPDELTEDWQKKVVGLFTGVIKIPDMDYIEIS